MKVYLIYDTQYNNMVRRVFSTQKKAIEWTTLHNAGGSRFRWSCIEVDSEQI